MKYIEILIVSIIAVLGFVMSMFFEMHTISYEITVFFTLTMLVILSSIISVSSRAFILFRSFDNIYFSASYGLILLLVMTIITRQISYNTYNAYYFNLIKYIEIIIMFFGVFVLQEKIKNKKIAIGIVLISVVNLVYFFFIMKIHHVNYLAIILYMELLYIYWKIDDKVIKRFWMAAISYKIVSELFMIVSKNNKLDDIYIVAYIFYLYSLIKLILYFNHTLNKGYFKQMFLKEKKFNKLIGIMSDGIIVTSGYFIKKINKSGLDILGYNNKREIVGKNIFSAFEGVKKEDIDNAVKSYPKESRIEFKKYNEKDRKIKTSAFRIAGEYMEENIVVFKKDYFLENGLTKLNNSLKVISFIYEENYGFKYISRAVKEVIDIIPELLNKNSDMFIDSVIEKDRDKYLELITKGGKDEIKVKNSFGKIVHFLVNSSKINIEEKEVVYGIMIDITEYKEKEEILEKKNYELEERNAKKEMGMSIVSHEIRTPITAIIGFVENILINKDAVAPDLIKMIYKIYGNSIRLKELVNNFLDYNKLNAGKMELVKENIELYTIVEEVITNNEMLMEIKGIKCENLLKTGIYVYVDATMIYQVINNIVSNAIKYNKENGEIKAEAEINGNIVILKISDTGVGIKPENIDSVFKEYERVKGVKEKGTGLGMPISKRFIELNGGSIWITSEYGKGSCFYISIPISSF